MDVMSTVTVMPSALGGTRYKEVKEAILAALSTPEWKGGAAIPSEKRLAERLGVSIDTLRKAKRSARRHVKLAPGTRRLGRIVRGSEGTPEEPLLEMVRKC